MITTSPALNTAFIETIADEYVVPDGMPLAVFNNKYSRVKSVEPNPAFDPSKEESPVNQKTKLVYQTWGERIKDVVLGSFTLDPRLKECGPENIQNVLENPEHYANASTEKAIAELQVTHKLSRQGVMAYAGRHLQHGDKNQYKKIGEYFTNCSTALFSWSTFFLLLKGSGVGRDYSAATCFVDWNYMPDVRFVLEGPNQWGQGGHPDYQDWIESLQSAQHKYDSDSERVRWFTVEDSAEGWMKAVTILETAAFHKNNKDHLFIFDFSKIRASGTPIGGQQDRPASGPIPFIKALMQVAAIKNAGMKPWKQALFIDHYLASCVALGGIRRSARMATKWWKDRDIMEFADIKREGFLTSANNSILVDAEFWSYVQDPTNRSPWAVHARRVFNAATEAAYLDGTGEPGFINVDKLTNNPKNLDMVTADNYINPDYYERLGGMHHKTKHMIGYMLDRVKQNKYLYIVNPCAEIPLSVYGAYCIIGDVCLTYARTLEEATTAFKLMAKFLMRVNLMPMLYKSEVARTNRIGVGFIGVFEFAWNHFGLSFRDIISVLNGNNNVPTDRYERALQFAQFMEQCNKAVEESCREYAEEIGVEVPHTFTCLKPAGTVSKVMTSTEAANLPANNFYLRNNQYLINDQQYIDLVERGYPSRDVSHAYPGHHVVGFPTKQQISDIMGDECIVVGDTTPKEQYDWLRWLEKYWINTTGNENSGGQVSYCLTEDHIVTTSEGMFRINDPAILHSDAQDRFGKPNKVFDLVDNGVKHVSTVRLSNGVEIEGTKNHRILTVCNSTADFVWKKIKDIAVGDVVVRRIGDNLWAKNPATLPAIEASTISGKRGNLSNVFAPATTSKSFALFLGMLMSDGSIGKNGVAFTSSDEKIAKKFQKLVAKLFGLTSSVHKDKRAANLFVIQANSRPLSRWLLSLGVANYHDDNRVPSCILQSPKKIVASFLKGYTLDSHVNGSVCITTTSKQMAKDLCALVNNMGMDASIAHKDATEYVAPNSSGMAKEQYVFMLRNVARELFAREVGFLESYKQEKAEFSGSYNNNGKTNMLPIAPFKAYSSTQPANGKLRKRLSWAASHTSSNILEMVSGFDHLRDPSLAFTKVDSITQQEVAVPTFDISVERSHEYVANSVVVHNTMKYYPDQVSLQDFQKILIEDQSAVKCCSWMQIMDMSKFPYQPEEPITKVVYDELMAKIDRKQTEDYDEESLACEGGVCPMERNQVVFTDGSQVNASSVADENQRGATPMIQVYDEHAYVTQDSSALTSAE